MRFFTGFAVFLGLGTVQACELCGIYSAGSVVGESSQGLIFTVAEQYIPYGNPMLDGREVTVSNPNFVDSSITHLIPGFNFSSRFGVSLSVPITYLNFRRSDVRYSPTAPPVNFTETGSEFGLGDVALIGRASLVQITSMRYGLVVNFLGGVKFPTGDSSRIKDEVDQARIFESFLPPGTPHDPLGHSVASVHAHQLALGSGSYDGVFGLTMNSRYDRWFFNAQFQYYLRTHGQSGFRFGDEIIISGGPGGFLFVNDSYTLSLQLNAVYDSMGRDEILGRASNRTGSTAWYLGPGLNLSIGEHFSATAGVEFPLHITNNGFQSMPDCRVHGGFSWRF